MLQTKMFYGQNWAGGFYAAAGPT